MDSIDLNVPERSRRLANPEVRREINRLEQQHERPLFGLYRGGQVERHIDGKGRSRRMSSRLLRGPAIVMRSAAAPSAEPCGYRVQSPSPIAWSRNRPSAPPKPSARQKVASLRHARTLASTRGLSGIRIERRGQARSGLQPPVGSDSQHPAERNRCQRRSFGGFAGKTTSTGSSPSNEKPPPAGVVPSSVSHAMSGGKISETKSHKPRPSRRTTRRDLPKLHASSTAIVSTAPRSNTRHRPKRSETTRANGPRRA